jgi:POT family proton-dependent oligopeptide transporter
MPQEKTTPQDEVTFLGHPIGLSVLFGTETGERFCFYGMRALLTFYMVDYLFTGTRTQDILGYGTLNALLQSASGHALLPQQLASLIYGLYTSGTYLLGLIGGFAADALLGQRAAVLVGAITMATGEFLLTSPRLFLIGLPVLVLGNGFFKPNIATQVGGLYKPGDARIDRAYAVFYVGVNLGALLAPIIVGRLGHAAAGQPPTWHWGFAAAGVGMLVSLFIYLIGQRVLPPDVRARRLRAQPTGAKFTAADWRAIGALCVVAVFNVFFWACTEQQGNTIALLAQDHTDLMTPLFALKPEDIQAFNPFFIFTMTPVIMTLWRWQAARRSEPSPVIKMAIGCAFTALGFWLLAVPGGMIDGGAKISWLWLLVALGLLTIGELYLAPVALSLFSKAAPAKAASVMMAVNLLSNAGGNYLAGYLGTYWSVMTIQHFFLMIGAVAAATALGIFLASFLVRSALAARMKN